jgi:hypothetical protein
MSEDRFWSISAVWQDDQGERCEPITNVTTHGDISVHTIINGPMQSAYRQVLAHAYGADILSKATFHADEINRDEFEPLGRTIPT